MFNLLGVPTAYQGLAEALVSEGFAIQVGDPDDSRFGDQVACLTHDRVRLRLVRDRGDWFLEIAASLTDEWFAPVVWMPLRSEGLPYPRRPTPVEEAEFVAEHGAEFDSDDTPRLLTQLLSWRDLRAAQRRELPPKVAP